MRRLDMGAPGRSHSFSPCAAAQCPGAVRARSFGDGGSSAGRDASGRTTHAQDFARRRFGGRSDAARRGAGPEQHYQDRHSRGPRRRLRHRRRGRRAQCRARAQAGEQYDRRRKKIETVVAPTDTRPDTTIRQARKLIEQDKVDIIIGPLSGSEGIAMRDFAKTIPNNVVINGISGALETTWVDPAPNFYRFNLDGAQWGFGLGSYAVKTKGTRRSPRSRPTIRSATPTSWVLRSTTARGRRHRAALLAAAGAV